MVLGSGGVTVTEEMDSNSRMHLKVTISKERAMSAYTEVMKQLSKDVRVPGFRPGAKVNPTLLAQSYGVKNVKAAVLEDLLNKTMPEAMAGVAARALDESDRIETDISTLFDVFTGPAGEPTQDIEYTIGVDVAPEIKWTGSYKDISVEIQATDNEGTIQAAADKEFTSKLKDLGTLRVVADRPVQEGDVAVIDLKACRVESDGSDGEEIPGVNNKNFRFDTSEGDGFLPGLVQGVSGISTGETKVFELNFPKDWVNESLRGQVARFSATVKETFFRDLPKVEDALAPKLVEEATTIEEVRSKLLAAAAEKAKAAQDQNLHHAITDQVADMVEVSLPDSLVQEQGRQNYTVRMLELLGAGQITKDVLNTMMTEEMVGNYIDKNRADVERMVRLTLAVGDIQKRESLVVTEEALKAECANSRAEFERQGQQYDEERLVEQARELLEGGLVLDWLTNNCNITIKPLEPEESDDKDGAVLFKF